MSRAEVLYDVSELVQHPLRTGIQRVTYEICSRWPGPSSLVPCIVDESTADLYRLSPEVFELIDRFFRAPRDGAEAEREALMAARAHGRKQSVDQIRAFRAVLNPELFFSSARLRFYDWLLSVAPRQVYWIAYDFLPWLHPEVFDSNAVTPTMGYLRVLRRVPHIAFISQATKDDFVTRILRQERPTGPVIPLGSDALGTSPPSFDPTSRGFAVLGTIERRKNHGIILDAFEQLWAQDSEAELLFLGSLGWVPDEVAARLHRLEREEPRFSWYPGLSDTAVAEVLRGCRASIYASRLEGFGLPPLESLALGVPVVVSDSIPSMRMMPVHGQLRLDEPDAGAIAMAVQQLMDDGFAARKTAEIAQLELPTWEGLGRSVAAWVEGGHGPGR